MLSRLVAAEECVVDWPSMVIRLGAGARLLSRTAARRLHGGSQCSAQSSSRAMSPLNAILQHSVGLASCRTYASNATIFAQATPPGRSAISITRISGPDALLVWHRLTRHPGRLAARRTRAGVGAEQQAPKPRQVMLREIYQPSTGETLDEAIVIFMPRACSRARMVLRSEAHRCAPQLRTR